MKLQRSKVKSKQLFYLHLNRNNNNGIVSTYFLDRFVRSVYTIKCKTLVAQSCFPGVSIQ